MENCRWFTPCKLDPKTCLGEKLAYFNHIEVLTLIKASCLNVAYVQKVFKSRSYCADK